MLYVNYHPISDDMDLQAIFDIVARRSDDWLDAGAVEHSNSSLDIDFTTRHPFLSYSYLTLLGVLTIVGNVANLMVISISIHNDNRFVF